MTPWLTPEELETYTGKTERAQKRYGSQATVLTALGVPFTVRPDKTLIVCRAHIDAPRPPEKTPEPAPTVCL